MVIVAKEILESERSLFNVLVRVWGSLGTFHLSGLLGFLFDVLKNLLLFELSVLEFLRDDQVLGSGILNQFLFLLSCNPVDSLDMRFGSLRSHLFVGLALLASCADLLHVVNECSLPLLLTLLSGLLGLVDLAGHFSGLLNFEVDHFRSKLISSLKL